MANAFSTIKENQAQTRFNLIRINPRRYVNDELTAATTGQYTMPFTYPVSGITRNDTSLTSVTTPSSADEYSYDESADLITMEVTAGSTNVIVVHYYVFYTSSVNRTIYEDPEDSATTLRDWEPRIESLPNMDFSIENVTEGILSISMSSVDIINADGAFQQYLSDTDSFYKCPIKVWLCLDSVANIQKIFDGLVTSVNIAHNKVRLSLNDPLSYLNEIATMGEDADNLYLTPDGWADMDKNYDGYPFRYFIGTASKYQLLSDTAITGVAGAKKLAPESLYDAVCTDYSDTMSTTTNRQWTLGRVSSDGLLDFGFTTSDATSAGAYTVMSATGTAVDIAKFKIGDTFTVAAGPDVFVRAVYVDTTNHLLYTTQDANIAKGDVVEGNTCPSLVITNGSDETYYCLYQQDYTAAAIATPSGSYFIRVTFEDNFEANHAGLTTLDPTLYQVKFRIRPDTTHATHGEVLKSILVAAGATVNNASISSADTALAVNACFSMPQYDEDSFDSYLYYAQLILSSTFGYLTLNNDFEIEYHLYASATSSTEITDTQILEKTFSAEIDYQDIANEIIAYNPHYASSEAQKDSTDTPSVTSSSLISKYLHNINKVVRFRHVLESINTRLAVLIKYRSERSAKYMFTTSLTNADNILGDDIQLTKDRLLGDVSSKDVKIISLSKNARETSLITTDLLDI